MPPEFPFPPPPPPRVRFWGPIWMVVVAVLMVLLLVAFAT
jgi:hypothetical protein